MLTSTLAGALAGTALASTVTDYPYKLDLVLDGTHDLATPRQLHPVFWGSYDWHSCVHMHWTLVRLLRRHPEHALAENTRIHLAARLTRDAVAAEIRTLRGPHRATFERPYGRRSPRALPAAMRACCWPSPKGAGRRSPAS